MKRKEKREKPKKEKTMEIKEKKIETIGIRLVGKVILWLLVLFLIICGVRSILSASSEEQLMGMVENYSETMDRREALLTGATTFAENYVTEYYTYSGQFNTDYVNRVSKFTAKNLTVKDHTAGKTAAKVLSCKAYHVGFVNDKQLDIDLTTKVQYTSLEDNSVSTSELSLRIPVSIDEAGAFAVTSTPLIIPAKEMSEELKVESTYEGTTVSSNEKSEIQTVLESFFKTYCEGTDNEVEYYVSEDCNVRQSLQGVVSFQKIEMVSVVVAEGQENLYYADVTFSVLDRGEPFEIRTFLHLTKEGSRYYISQMLTRAN